MTTLRHRSAVALTAAAALAIGVIPAAFTTSSILASGEGTTTLDSATDYFPGPTLTLSTVPEKGSVTLSGSELRQEFDGGQFCQITPFEGAADLLTFEGTIEGSALPREALAGFRDGSVGVFEGENASQCFRVDAASFTTFETLTLGLGSALEGLMASSGTLDLEMKSNDNKIKIEARDADGPVNFITTDASGVVTSDSFTIYTGRERREAVAGPFTLLSTAKSGSHIAFTLPELEGPFLKLKLTSLAGSFTLEGGSDAGATKTTLTLVQPADVAEFCPEASYPEGQASVTYVGEATGLVNTGDNTWGGECFGIQLTDGDAELRFLKPLEVSPDAQFLFTKTWTKSGSFGPSVTLDGVEIDFEFFADQRYSEMLFCPDYLYTDGVLTGFTPANPASDAELADLRSRDMVTDDPNTPVVEGDGTQFACIGEPRQSFVSGDEITILDNIYLIGDAFMKVR